MGPLDKPNYDKMTECLVKAKLKNDKLTKLEEYDCVDEYLFKKDIIFGKFEDALFENLEKLE